jgi:HSP20 family protein
MATRNSSQGNDRSRNDTRSSSGGSESTRSASSRGGGAGTSDASSARETREASASTSGRTAASETAGPRSDRQQNLETSRESGRARGMGPQQREMGVGQQRGLASPFFSGGPVSPFTMMRRMMEDMDRLFTDFTFTQPLLGAIESDEVGLPQSSQRLVGRGSQGGGLQRPGQSAGRGVQRGGAFDVLDQGLWSPQIEVFERGNELVIRADLPGLKKENVQLEVADDALIIRGERRSEIEDQESGFYRTERVYGSFYRAIPIPEHVEADQIKASFNDGVLEIRLPRPQQRQSGARRVDIR